MPDKTNRKKNSRKDFKLNEKYYEELDSFEVYSTEKKSTRVFGVRNKNTNNPEPYIKARTRSKSPYGWRYIYGIDLLSSRHVSRIIRGFLDVAQRLGWKINQTEDIEEIKSQLRDKEEVILGLEKTNEDLRAEHEELMVTFRKKQDEILHSKAHEFDRDFKKLNELLTSAKKEKVPEKDLQEFLYSHPWFFGTEYINAEPQKLRGAHSKFDFYLERFNKTSDIVEIKLPSDQIINKDGSLNAKVLQAVDQIIGYMESSQAAAHSKVIGEEEGIYELRPRGIVIIGGDFSKEAKEKLQKWNYQLAHISVLTYSDLADRAKIVIQHLKGNK